MLFVFIVAVVIVVVGSIEVYMSFSLTFYQTFTSHLLHIHIRLTNHSSTIHIVRHLYILWKRLYVIILIFTFTLTLNANSIDFSSINDICIYVSFSIWFDLIWFHMNISIEILTEVRERERKKTSLNDNHLKKRHCIYKMWITDGEKKKILFIKINCLMIA